MNESDPQTVQRHFQNIKIQNFKGIDYLELENVSAINLLVGPNNTCKTTVLEALFLLCDLSDPNACFNRKIRQNDQNYEFLFYDAEYKAPIRIEATRTNGFRKLTIKSNRQTNKRLLFKVTVEHSTEKQTKETFDFQNFNGFDNNLKLKAVAVKTPTPKSNDDFADKLQGILYRKKEMEIVELLKIIDSRIEQFRFGANKVIYIDSGTNAMIPLSWSGTGVQNFLALILDIESAANGIILIDEIENGFHFSTLELIWKVIYETAKKFKVQVFATTHNVEVLKYLSKAAGNSSQTFQEALKIHTIHRDAEHKLFALNYGFEALEYSVEQEMDIR